MRIVVISDTHLESPDQLPSKVLEEMDASDLVIHCGDFIGVGVLTFLRERFPFEGVRGNMDSIEVCSQLPEKKILEIEGKKVGIIHGWGSPSNLAQKVLNRFPPMDLILYGHSHAPSQESLGSTHVFNPGTLSSFALKLRKTYGIIEIGPHGIQGKILPI
jgi:putative phosphoesterase